MPKRNLIARDIHRRMVEDSRFGYSWSERWGAIPETWTVQGQRFRIAVGDYDCSSSTITAWRKALEGTSYGGKLDRATYTGNMRSVFLASGLFEWKPMSFIAKPGDLYLNEANHVAMCCVQEGNVDTLTEFSGNEHGGAYGGRRGDQTGWEAHLANYYDYPWDGILHYNGKADSAMTANPDCWPLHMWGSNGANSQRFAMKDAGNGTVTFVCKADGRAIDVRGGKAANGTEVCLYKPHGGSNQKWKLVEVAGKPGHYVIASALDANMVLDVRGGSSEPRTGLCTQKKNGLPHQEFVLFRNSDGTVSIAANLDGAKTFLDCKGGGK